MNRRPSAYTYAPHNRPTGLTFHKHAYYYRRRVPRILQPIIGKKEVWRSLNTDSISIARRRLHWAAVGIESAFETAREALRLPIDQALLQPGLESRHDTFFVQELVQHVRDSLQTKPAASSMKTFGEICGLFCNDPRHGWCKRTEGAYATTRRWALDVLGAETSICEITREHCREFLTLLLGLPAHCHLHYRGLTIRQAVSAAEGRQVRIISAANVNAHMTRLGAIFNWAVDEGYLERNPARSLRIPDPVPSAEKRSPFSPHQLRLIFKAPIYTGCEDDWYGYAKAGPSHPRRARFWVPLIALFSGMRLNEICQLDVADVAESEGILCFRVAANQRSAKRIKTRASERIIPVHPELRHIGFPAFLAERRRSGDTKLFAELPVSKLGYHSVGFSRWFSRFLEASGATADRTCFHSFRHNFRDALRDGGVGREIALLLGGWSSGAGASGIADLYGGGFRAARLSAELEKVNYAYLDLSHLHVP